MKKLLLMSTLCLGVLVAAGCSDNNSAVIQIADSTGGTQEVVINKTDDQEVVQQVIDYAEKANYDDVESYKVVLGIKLDEKLNNKPISLNASLTALVDAKKGFDLTGKATINDETGLLLSSISAMAAAPTQMDVKLSGTVEGHAQYVIPQPNDDEADNNIYADYSVDYSAAFAGESTSAKQSSKIKTDFTELVEMIKNEMGNSGVIVPPSTGDPSMPSIETIDDFKAIFTNSKISISDVVKDCISVKVDISMKDMLILSGAPAAEVNKLTKDAYVSVVEKIDPANGRTKGFSIFCESKDQFFDFLKEAAAKEGTSTEIDPEMTAAFTIATGLSLDLSIEYNAGAFTALTEAQKAQYNLVQ